MPSWDTVDAMFIKKQKKEHKTQSYKRTSEFEYKSSNLHVTLLNELVQEKNSFDTTLKGSKPKIISTDTAVMHLIKITCRTCMTFLLELERIKLFFHL
jgi:hypothetical protein